MKSKSKYVVNWSKIITHQPKAIDYPDIDIKLVTIEHSETSHILCKILRLAKKVSQIGGEGSISNCPLYSETKKPESVFGETKTIKKPQK